MNKTTWITYQLESFVLDDGVKYDKRDTEEDKDDAGSGENSFMAYGDYYDTFYDQEEERTLTLRKQASVTTLEWWMLDVVFSTDRPRSLSVCLQLFSPQPRNFS